MKEYGYFVEDSMLICPNCADNPLYQGLLTTAEGEGYPEGYTCADCNATIGKESEIHKCAECGNMTEDMGYKVQDSFHGLQYLCSQDCVDTYEGWWCDTCDLLHDHDTTMESDNSCQKESK